MSRCWKPSGDACSVEHVATGKRGHFLVFSVRIKADSAAVVLRWALGQRGKEVRCSVHQGSAIHTLLHQPQTVGDEMVPRKRRTLEPVPPTSDRMFSVNKQRVERLFCDHWVHRFDVIRTTNPDRFLFKDENLRKQRTPWVQFALQMVEMLGAHRQNRLDGAVRTLSGRLALALPQKAPFPNHIAARGRVAALLELCPVDFEVRILVWIKDACIEEWGEEEWKVEGVKKLGLVGWGRFMKGRRGGGGATAPCVNCGVAAFFLKYMCTCTCCVCLCKSASIFDLFLFNHLFIYFDLFFFFLPVPTSNSRPAVSCTATFSSSLRSISSNCGVDMCFLFLFLPLPLPLSLLLLLFFFFWFNFWVVYFGGFVDFNF